METNPPSLAQNLAQQPLKIALLGAESTGKTQLSQALADAARQRGLHAQVVPEVLRQWCDQRGRTPQAHEQQAIAHEQARCVDAAAQTPGLDWLIADTTALTIAVYSEFLFADPTLHPFAATHQRQFHITLLMGLDMPWVADGLQRDGPQVRVPVDGLLRQALARAQVSYQVIYGLGEQRVAQALRAIEAAQALRAINAAQALRAIDAAQAQIVATDSIAALAISTRAVSPFDLNRHPLSALCAQCGDAACERHLFSALLGRAC